MRKPHVKKIIAVIGTGRSGTHMLGHLIDTSKDVTASIEDDVLFPLITKNATSGLDEKDISQVTGLLKERLTECPTSIYLEKSHPLVWFAALPQLQQLPIKYIGIIRDPFAVIASMLQHAGTRSWVENWKELPHPNIFLGISQENIERYANMTLVQKCAMRWLSHTQELIRLQYILPSDKYLLISYEELVLSQKSSIAKLKEFTGIKDIGKAFELREDSLSKWKDELHPNQVREIADVLIDHGFSSYVA